MLELDIVRKRFPEARPVWGGSGLEYNVNCPFYHKKGGIGKMDINAESGIYYCHDCGARGDATRDFLFAYLDPFPTLRIQREPQELAPHLQRPVHIRHGGPVLENNVPSPGAIISLTDLPDDHPACQYMATRGFDIQELKGLKGDREIKYCTGPLNGRGRKACYGRLVFPVYSGGILRAWQARKIDRTIDKNTREVWNGEAWVTVRRRQDGRWEDDGEQKYLFNYGIQKTQILYGIDSARQNGMFAVVVEGVMDCLRVGPHGVATFGLVSQAQKMVLKAAFNQIILALDPDIREDHPDPRVRAKFKTTISGWEPLSVKWFYPPDGKDPADTPRNILWQCIRNTQTIDDSEFQKVIYR